MTPSRSAITQMTASTAAFADDRDLLHGQAEGIGQANSFSHGQKEAVKVTPVIRRSRRRRGHLPDGAWKVAMADFALAMMALFMVLWVVNSSSPEQRKAISEYFRPDGGRSNPSLGMIPQQPPASPYVIDFGGSPLAVEQQLTAMPEQPSMQLNSRDLDDLGDSLDQRRWQPVKQQLEALVYANPTLQQFDHQLAIDIDDSGLKLQLLDRQQTPMFSTGGAQLSFLAEDILWELGPILAELNYRIALIGHTDSMPVRSRDNDDGNWGLSANRANAARKALMESGVSKQQIAYVMGVGDTLPIDPSQPNAAVNRRIAITLLAPLTNYESSNNDSLMDSNLSINQKGSSSVEQNQIASSNGSEVHGTTPLTTNPPTTSPSANETGKEPAAGVVQQLQEYYQALFEQRRDWF